MRNEISRFVVVRIDRRGELATTYLQYFVLVGRKGLRELTCGPVATAHLFDRRGDAEDIARKLRRRVSDADYEYRTEEAISERSSRLAAFHWQ